MQGKFEIDPSTVYKKLVEISDSLTLISKDLNRISQFASIQFQPKILSTLSEFFNSYIHLHAYELTDGEHSTREIAKELGVAQKTVSRWWVNWEKQSIAKQISKNGPYTKLYSLNELMFKHLSGNTSTE